MPTESAPACALLMWFRRTKQLNVLLILKPKKSIMSCSAFEFSNWSLKGCLFRALRTLVPHVVSTGILYSHHSTGICRWYWYSQAMPWAWQDIMDSSTDVPGTSAFNVTSRVRASPTQHISLCQILEEALSSPVPRTRWRHWGPLDTEYAVVYCSIVGPGSGDSVTDGGCWLTYPGLVTQLPA